ncbi:MAG: hypothetical protein KF887_16625 [Paracoccaceae bacterium]|nr:MAG: hypothetical protein KF887_16625 [Paracoccaceae bacterium]
MTRLLALIALILYVAGPARAQEVPTQDELLALNFYVGLKDAAAVSAELRRLQLKYPGWTPPADLSRLSGSGPSTEIDEIYAKIAAGQIGAARAQIAETETAYPGWSAPSDMLALLATAEGQLALDVALEAGNLDQAIRIATGTPGLLRCDRINNAWRIAETQAAAGRRADALGTYRAVLAACTDFAAIAATLEKADAVSEVEALRGLFGQASGRFPDRAADLDALLARLLAGRGVAVPGTSAQSPAAAPAAAPARPASDPAVPQTRPPAAPAASAAAPAQGGGGGVQAAARAGDWSRCLAQSEGARSAAVLYERAWCAYNLDRTMEALSAFQAAEGGGLDATRRRDARYGMALAYLKMQMTENAAAIAAATDFTRSQRVDVERQILDQRGVAAFKKRQYRKSIEYFDALEQLTGGIRRDLAVLRAYAYLNSGNAAEARRQFEVLNRALSTRETREGLRAAEGSD